MAVKKIYAVRRGKKTGLFYDWDSAKKSITGFSGAEYKGFTSKEEAENYLQGETNVLGGHLPEAEAKDTLITYVDGSYEASMKKYAFGCVFILPDGRVFTENGGGNNPESAQLRNVTGEMLGAMYAVRWALKNGFKKVEICYDYEGLEKWVTGAWKSKTSLTQKYATWMQLQSNQITMKFTKVAAHTNILYNELADKLAKEGISKNEEIPEVKSMEDMIPWKAQD